MHLLSFSDSHEVWDATSGARVSFPSALGQVLESYGFDKSKPLNIVVEHGTCTLTAVDAERALLLERITAIKAGIAQHNANIDRASEGVAMRSIEQRREIHLFVGIENSRIRTLHVQLVELERAFLDAELAAYLAGRD